MLSFEPSLPRECDNYVIIGLDDESSNSKKDDCEAGYSQEIINRSSPSPTYFLPFEHCMQQELVQHCRNLNSTHQQQPSRPAAQWQLREMILFYSCGHTRDVAVRTTFPHSLNLRQDPLAVRSEVAQHLSNTGAQTAR
jgi:hypothetical protein